MSNDNIPDDENHPVPFQLALEGTKDPYGLIVAELRKMADGREEYRKFLYTSKWIKNIWRAAADMIEESHKSSIK